jgi:hypothetical protein
LESVPLNLYSPRFELESFSYSADALSQIKYEEVLRRLSSLKKPLILLITQREGSQLSFAREHSLYFRMDVVGGALTFSSVEECYFSGGHIWGDEVLTIHVSMANTYFFGGSAASKSRLMPSFLREFRELVGVSSLDIRAVVLAGGGKDLEWFSNPSSLRGSRENGSVRRGDRVRRIRDVAGSHFDQLLSGFRQTCPDVELIVVGCGSKANHTCKDPNTVSHRSANAVDPNMSLSSVTEEHFEGLVEYFLDFLDGVRRGHESPSSNEDECLWTSSPLDNASQQCFNAAGLLLPSYREAYAMGLCNAVLRGFG